MSLVDNAAQPMQAALVAALEGIAVSGILDDAAASASTGLASFALHRWLHSPPHRQDRRRQAEVARPSALLRLPITRPGALSS